MQKEYDVIAIGNILVDYVANIEEDILKKLNLTKNVMTKMDIDFIKNLDNEVKDIKKYPGGSAPNVMHGLANLGLKSAVTGMISKDDDGEIFAKDLEASGIKNCLIYKDGHTGVAATLITPDGERTFIVTYGVADKYNPKDIDKEALAKSKYFHTTGYEFESMNKTVKKAVKLSKEYGTKVSFDLGDPNVVLRNKKSLKKFLKSVDVLFANEEEAKNFTGKKTPEESLEVLAKHCGIVVVKLGKEGSLVKSGDMLHKVKGYKAKLVNTNGAGDGFAAGFLYGLCMNHDLELSCKIGNLYASKIVEQPGARLSYPIGHIEWWVKLSENS
ncbi:adenosine kinase [Candidatus Woesearchaeota archaeon]|nr:adenosine kinase [Candidatus Woesearchaeota archaeon]